MVLKFFISVLAVLAFGSSSTLSLANYNHQQPKIISKAIAESGAPSLQQTMRRTKLRNTHFALKRGKRIGYILELVVSCFDVKTTA